MRLKCNRKQFQWEVCENLFKNNSVMVVHKRIHLGKTPYNCEDCGERFSWTSSFNSYCNKQQILLYCKNDESVINLISYDVNAEQNNCKLNNHQQIYSGEYLIIIEARDYYC